MVASPHRVIAIFGTRPEAIKLAPVIDLLIQDSDYDVLVASTGQHGETLKQTLESLDVRVDVDLDIFQPGLELEALTARVLESACRMLDEFKPAFVIVQGDTTSALSTALAAFFRGVPVAHLEAGLRTSTPGIPFPEEMNRRLLSRIAGLHLAPTGTARRNLDREGISENVIVTGNTVIDAFLAACSRDITLGPPISDLLNSGWPLVLVTAHRRESWGAPIRGIAHAVATLALRNPEYSFIFPIHPNPALRHDVMPLLEPHDNVHLIEPLAYVPFCKLVMRASLVLTDSGGIQEEAPSVGKPVVVMRDETDRPEAVAAGTVQVVGTKPHHIVSTTEQLLREPRTYAAMAEAVNPYGDGLAAERVVGALRWWHGRGPRPDDFTPTAYAEQEVGE